MPIKRLFKLTVFPDPVAPAINRCGHSFKSVTIGWPETSFPIGKAKGEYKNKERMVMNTLISDASWQTTDITVDDTGVQPSVTNVGDTNAWMDNYSSGDVQETWDIDQLKGKEMIVKITRDNSGSWSSTTSGGVTTSGPNDVFTSTETITLSIVK